jgi:hypothetical protein
MAAWVFHRLGSRNMADSAPGEDQMSAACGLVRNPAPEVVTVATVHLIKAKGIG